MPLRLIWHPPPFIQEHQEVAHLWWYLLLISRQPFAAVSCEPDPRICKRQLFRHPFATSKPHMNKSNPKIFLASNCLSWRFLALVRFWLDKQTTCLWKLKSSSLGHFVFHVAVRHLCLRNTREETMQSRWETQGDDCDHGLAGWKILETRLPEMGFVDGSWWFDASVSTTEAFTRVARTWQVVSLCAVSMSVACSEDLGIWWIHGSLKMFTG